VKRVCVRVRRKTKALLHEQPPDDITAHYAPCAEPRHFRPSGTSWASLGRREPSVHLRPVGVDGERNRTQGLGCILQTLDGKVQRLLVRRRREDLLGLFAQLRKQLV
jgi:hypothetical protein